MNVDPKELRIGNKIEVGALYAEYGEGTVCEILADSVTVFVNREYHQYLFDDLKPIPITEDRLCKIGFKETSMFLYFGNLSYEKERKRWFWFDVPISPKKLMFVHQLQNFIYSINGKEL